MKKLIVFLLVLVPFLFAVNSVDAKTSSFRMKSYKSFSNGGRLYMQRGYIRKSTGKYVMPHLKTKSDNTIYNNRKYILGY